LFLAINLAVSGMRGNTARGLTSGRHADRQATAMVVAVGGVEKTFVVSEGCLQKYCVGPIGIVALVGACCRQKQSVVFFSQHHGLRGSASPVLTATGFVNGRWQFSTPHRIHTP